MGVALLLLSSTDGWSLPPCPGSPFTGSVSDVRTWNNCEGTFIFDSPPEFLGNKYVGEWKDGKPIGQGTYYYLADNKFKGDKYVGEIKYGKKHGQGTITFANGNKYVGEWENDNYHGQGTFTWFNGNKYVGEYRDNKKHGQGKLTHADGRTKEGIWDNGDFKYAKKLSPTVTAKKPPLEKAKEQCAEIGFTKGTEKFGKCVMKLLN